MPKYILRDGSTLETISIEEAEKELKKNGGEHKESVLDKLTAWLYYWWNKNQV